MGPIFLGHNGLMDFDLEHYPVSRDNKKREVIVFGCISEPYFKERLERAGASPYLLTTNLMASEACCWRPWPRAG